MALPLNLFPTIGALESRIQAEEADLTTWRAELQSLRTRLDEPSRTASKGLRTKIAAAEAERNELLADRDAAVAQAQSEQSIAALRQHEAALAGAARDIPAHFESWGSKLDKWRALSVEMFAQYAAASKTQAGTATEAFGHLTSGEPRLWERHLDAANESLHGQSGAFAGCLLEAFDAIKEAAVTGAVPSVAPANRRPSFSDVMTFQGGQVRHALENIVKLEPTKAVLALRAGVSADDARALLKRQPAGRVLSRPRA